MKKVLNIFAMIMLLVSLLLSRHYRNAFAYTHRSNRGENERRQFGIAIKF